MAVQPNYNSILQQAQTQASNAIQPALQQLESTKPNLKTQYDTLIGQLKGRETQDITQQDRISSQNLEERGILGGAYSPQFVQEKQQPIKQYYTGQNQQAYNTYQTGLTDLASRVAQLQSGANQSAIQNALSLFGQQSNDYQQDLNRQAQQRENELNRQAQLKASAAGNSSGGNLQGVLDSLFPKSDPTIEYQRGLADDIKRWSNGQLKNTNFLTFVQSYAKFLPLGAIKNIYMQNSPWGAPKETEAQIQQAYARGLQGVASGPVK